MSHRPQQTQPFPWLTDVEIVASGHYARGGVAFVSDGEHQGLVQLPPKLYAVLALLIEAAHETRSGLTSGFLGAKEMSSQFDLRVPLSIQQTGLEGSEIVRYVFRLRRALGKVLVSLATEKKARSSKQTHVASVDEWGKRLLEWQPYLGYRLSTSPKNLVLQLGEKPM